MPELTVIHIALLAVTTVIGAIAGWVLRGNRSQQEKAVVSSGWQEQIQAQRKEHDRLVHQNKGLMEQVSQFQASHNDAKNRAKELSSAVQEAFARRDDLQREIKDIRSNLEVAVAERDQLQSDVEARSLEQDLLRQKDERIEKLTQELENWQNRLPPLIERFRVRNEQAERLEANLVVAEDRIRVLESAREEANQTRIEPVRDPEELTDGLDASNDPADDFFDEEDSEPAVEQESDFLDDEDSAAANEPEAEPELEPEPEAVPDADAEAEAEAEAEIATDIGPPSLRDNLKRIKGVGPAIEKTLNEIGIFRFEQIADMSEYDIDRVARRLKGFHSRIYREDWIGQARELLDQAAHG
jgi:predicted flap endonuclease-1-like 5' DNA nuclease/predicted  nucleic acid-binding Zn-ribbon protein